MNIPKIDNYEASVPTMPQDLKTGDRVATGWTTHDTVLDVRPTPSGAYLTLAHAGQSYEIHRRTAVPVIHD